MKLTKEQRAKIYQDYLAGATQKALAEYYGVSQPAISKLVRRMRKLELEAIENPVNDQN